MLLSLSLIRSSSSTARSVQYQLYVLTSHTATGQLCRALGDFKWHIRAVWLEADLQWMPQGGMQYRDPSQNLPGQCEEQSLRPVLGLLPHLYPHFIALAFSRGALNRGHAVTAGSDYILITEAVSNVHSWWVYHGYGFRRKQPVEQHQIPDREGHIRCSLYTREDAAVSSPPGLHLPFPSPALTLSAAPPLLAVPMNRSPLCLPRTKCFAGGRKGTKHACPPTATRPAKASRCLREQQRSYHNLASATRAPPPDPSTPTETPASIYVGALMSRRCDGHCVRHCEE